MQLYHRLPAPDHSWTTTSVNTLKCLRGPNQNLLKQVVIARAELVRLAVFTAVELAIHMAVAGLKFTAIVIAPRVAVMDAGAHAARSAKLAAALFVAPVVGLAHPEWSISLYQKLSLVKQTDGHFASLRRLGADLLACSALIATGVAIRSRFFAAQPQSSVHIPLWAGLAGAGAMVVATLCVVRHAKIRPVPQLPASEPLYARIAIALPSADPVIPDLPEVVEKEGGGQPPRTQPAGTEAHLLGDSSDTEKAISELGRRFEEKEAQVHVAEEPRKEEDVSSSSSSSSVAALESTVVESNLAQETRAHIAAMKAHLPRECQDRNLSEAHRCLTLAKKAWETMLEEDPSKARVSKALRSANTEYEVANDTVSTGVRWVTRSLEGADAWISSEKLPTALNSLNRAKEYLPWVPRKDPRAEPVYALLLRVQTRYNKAAETGDFSS